MADWQKREEANLSHYTTSRSTTPLPENLAAPRILCLHGGGVNAEVFRAQSRALIRDLSPHFRLVFADGPFFCDPGPGIIPVYQDCGPFRRWLRWLPEHPEIDDESAIEEILYNIDTCKRDDEGTGPWVGLIGFSQGAKLSASLMYDQQIRKEKGDDCFTDYKFAVLLAGRSPLVSFSDHTKGDACVSAGGMSEGFQFDGKSPHILKLPALHYHGLADPGLHLHRKLLNQYCDPKTSNVIEWDGNHRVPIKKADVTPVVDWIFKTAKAQGVQLDV
ncbi:Esterase citA [Pseudocercospora fuligena]|uniref:Esterase citA n=1 Tax=Pseudocercospora fuligena TaxID=685502 RepID=A0A8H6RFR4_9PEZI|nr:Esterase citA [Pseudocercospora fuligena]